MVVGLGHVDVKAHSFGTAVSSGKSVATPDLNEEEEEAYMSFVINR